MDELELVVEHAALYERMRAGFGEPLEKGFHESRHPIGRRRRVHDVPRAVHDADLPAAERPRLVHETAHHQLMDFEQIFYVAGVDAFYLFVCRRRAHNLVYLSPGRDDALPLKQRRYMLFRQRVALDGGCAAYRLDSVRPAEPQPIRPRNGEMVSLNCRRNLGNEIHRIFAHLVRRNVGLWFFHRSGFQCAYYTISHVLPNYGTIRSNKEERERDSSGMTQRK